MHVIEDEQECAEKLREARWKDGIHCVHCGSDDVVKNGYREDHVRKYLCNQCETAFSDRTNTLFDGTRMRLSECFTALALHDRMCSVNSISKTLERKWSTVANFLRDFEDADQSFDPIYIANEVYPHDGHIGYTDRNS